MTAISTNRGVIKNTLWNLTGQTIPMIIALLTIPMLVKGLGLERFGVLTLAWTLISYFSLFDLGISRALTQFLSKNMGSDAPLDTSSIAKTALYILTLLGAGGGMIMFLIAPWLAHDILNVQESMRQEMLVSLYLLSLAVPFIIATSGLCGILAAHQRFDLINLVRIPTSIFLFSGPVLILLFSPSLLLVIGFLVIEQAVVCFVFLRICVRVMPGLMQATWICGSGIVPLLKFGTWMTISNIIGPVMVYMDRFFIGALISLSAVAYYVTPYEIVTKLWIVPGSIVSVIFPAFASSFTNGSTNVQHLYRRSIKYIALLLFPITLLIIAMAQDGLRLWLNADFAEQSTTILQWLMLGVFINSLAQVPLTLIQGMGRPDITTKIHLIELPCYLAVLFWLLKRYGIEGAAVAWCGRVFIDAILLFVIAHQLMPLPRKEMLRGILAISAAFCILFIARIQLPLFYEAVFIGAALLGFFLFVIYFMLADDEKTWLKESYLRYRWWKTC